MTDRFDGRVAWVTGGGSGIGREVALALAQQGATVVVSGRRKDRLTETVHAIETAGAKGLAVPCDVTDEEAVAAAVTEIVATLGRLDVVVANAGFSVAGAIEHLSAADWRRQLEVNVVGLATTAKHALPQLRKTEGRLCLIGSVSALIPAPNMGAYSASKYAVRAIGQTLAVELHGSGVSCTTVHPGFVESEIAKVDNEGRYHAKRKDRRPKQLMWPTDKAARVIVDAVWSRKREYVFTGHGRILAFLGKHAPGLVHLASTHGLDQTKRFRPSNT